MGMRVGVLGLCFTASLSAQEADMFDLSLQDLSQIKVTVSSHRPESWLETPSIVTRLDVAELSSMGLTRLTDLLSFVPGMTVQNHLFGQPFVSVRGIYEGFNQKVLFLVDDTPYFMSSHSDIPLRGIPMEAISHVEIIRGPGAVYYGTNATAGVIKVVTIKYTNTSTIKLAGDNHQGVSASGIHQWQKQEDTFMVAGQLESTHSEEVVYPSFDAFAEGTVTIDEKTQSIYGRWNRGNTQIVFHGFESDYGGIAQPRTINNANQLTYRGFLVSAEHREKVLGDVNTKLFFDINQFHLNFLIDDFVGGTEAGGFRMSNDGQDNYRVRLGLNLDKEFNNQLSGFMGLEWERRATDDYEMYNDVTDETLGTIMPAFAMSEWSLYGQLDIQPYEKGRMLVGARYTDNEIIGDSVVPRLALVHSLSPTSSLKALYSVGFNTPSFTQLKADFAGVVNGNESLSSEQIASFDLGYYWQSDRNQIGVTYFQFTAKDFVYSDRSTGVIEFYNSNSFKHDGVELEWEHSSDNHQRWLASISYLFDGNKEDDTDASAKFSAEITANIGYRYSFGAHSIGTSLRYVGERASAEELWLINTSYQFKSGNYRTIIQLKNLAESKRYQPNMAEFNDRLVPMGESGVTAEWSISYVF